MGDLARRVLYPLMLPFIVAAVWSYAWAMKEESRHAPMHETTPQAAVITVLPPLPAAARGYGFASDDASFATAGTDDAAD